MEKIAWLLLIIAGALACATCIEATLAFHSSAQPDEITLQALIARGPDGNANIILTDFVLCENLVFRTKDKDHANWGSIWIPVVPAEEAVLVGQGALRPNKVKALIFSNNIRNQIELEGHLNKPAVQGLVTNRISSLEKEIRQLLEQNYPGTDFDACLIIQEGRKPYSRVGLFAQGAGSALALLAAIGLFVAIRRKKPALRAARNIPAATAQVEPTLYYPGNDPQLADFFVPPPEEIGEILTAHTTLLKTKNPKSFMLRGLIGVVAGVGPCLILTLVTWLAWRLPAEAVIVIFVMSALLITPWTVVGAFYFTRFRHACRYVGDKGVARFTCARSRQRPKVSDRFLFSEADELRVWEDRCDQNGAIHTRYNFTWTDSEGNKVFVIKGNYQAKEDIPPKEDNYHFALASDWAWCEHLLDIILPVLRAGKEYFFRLHGDDGINCQSKFVEIHRNGEVQRLYPTDLAGVEIKDGTIWIMEPESKEGSFTSTGVHRFSFDKLANARAFLGVLREVYAVSLESRV